MDPLSALSFAYEIAKDIYRLVETVKANHNAARLLSQRIKISLSEIKEIQSRLGEYDYSKKYIITNAIYDLCELLKECRTFIGELASKNWIIATIKSDSYAGKFESMNNQLKIAFDRLGLNINTQHFLNNQQNTDALKADLQWIKDNQKNIAEELNKHLVHLSNIEQTVNEIRTRTITEPNPRLTVYPDEIEVPKQDPIYRTTTAKIYRARWQSQDVVKKMIIGSLLTDTQKSNFSRGIKILARLHSPHIVQLCGFYTGKSKDSETYYLMPYMSNGSLYDVLKKQDMALTAIQKNQIALEITQGLSYLHSQSIIHRTLKSSHILIDTDRHAKITDFAASLIRSLSINSPFASTNRSMQFYSAPETLEGTYNAATDVYALGVVLWELYCNKLAEEFISQDKTNENKNEQQIIKEKSTYFINHLKLLNNNIPTSHRALIIQCLSDTPDNRPSIVEICQKLSVYTSSAEEIMEHAEQLEKEAFHHYRRAAEHGGSSAKIKLSEYYKKGIAGVQQDSAEVFRLLKDASTSMAPNSTLSYKLGKMLSKGIGCKPNPEEARNHYESAAAMGHPKAIAILKEEAAEADQNTQKL